MRPEAAGFSENLPGAVAAKAEALASRISSDPELIKQVPDLNSACLTGWRHSAGRLVPTGDRGGDLPGISRPPQGTP